MVILMALIKCKDCGKDVSTLASNCPNCGRPVDEQQLPLSDEKRVVCPDGNCIGSLGKNGECGTCGKPADWIEDNEETPRVLSSNPEEQFSAKGLFLAAILIICGLGAVFFLNSLSKSNDQKSSSVVSPPVEQSAQIAAGQKDSPETTSTPTVPPPELTITTDQRLSEARKSLEADYQPNKDPMEAKWGHITEAEEHLRAITSFDNEQQKTDNAKLMKEIERRNKEIDKLSKAVGKKIAVQLRENLRDNLEKGFLNLGWNIEVTLKGKEKDILNLKYVLFSKAMVYKLTNNNDMSEGSFLLNIKKSGFKRVHFTNNYDYGEYWDFTK